MIRTEPAPRMSRLLLLVLIALVLAAVSGGVGYLLGWIGGQAGVEHATLRISVENRLSTDQTVTLLINGKVRQSLTIPHGQTTTVDQDITFAGPDGAWFEVRLTNPSGPTDWGMVYVASPGTYLVSLRLG